MSLHPTVIKRLEPLMNGFTIQELIRARIIPEWEKSRLGIAKLESRAYSRGYQAAKYRMKKHGSSREVPRDTNLPATA